MSPFISQGVTCGVCEAGVKSPAVLRLVLGEGLVAETPRPKSAPLIVHCGAGLVAGEQNAVTLSLANGVRNGDRGQQGLGIGVPGSVKDIIGVTDFDDAPEIHHGHTVCRLSHHR